MYPRLTLCIPTLNKYDFLKENLPKYLSNTYIDEIVISDESGDDCKKILQDFSFQVVEKKIILSTNPIKKGVSLAKYDWVCLIDADRFLGVGYFEAWLTYIKLNGLEDSSIYQIQEVITKTDYKALPLKEGENCIFNKHHFLRQASIL
jgi:glycosyltransferase involved in cell wall biosynthesis